MIYTKEPWEIQNGSTGPYIIAKDGNGDHVAVAQVFPRGIAGCETNGNAGLVKVSPKMYGALKQLTQVEQVTGKVCSLCGGYLEHKKGCLFPLAEGIIAEVEGGE